MHRNAGLHIALCLVVCLCFVASPWAKAFEHPELEEAFQTLRNYDWGQEPGAIPLLEEHLDRSHEDPDLRRALEQGFIGVLRSDSTRRAKDYACRKLYRIGTAASVSALADLLADPELSHMARYALESIPGPAAGEALREALRRTDDAVKIGIINSLGARRDEKAVPALIELTRTPDRAIVRVAVAALGNVADSRSIEALRGLLDEGPGDPREPVVGALVRAADRARDEGRTEAAARIYEEVYTSDAPASLRVGAYRGLVLSKGDRGADLLAKALMDPSDRAIHQAAVQLALEMPGRHVTETLAGLLGGAEADTKVRILEVLADRGDRGALGPVLRAAQDGGQDVRAAALRALGQVGNQSVVPLLARRAAEGEGSERSAAQQALNALSGPGVNRAMIELAAESPPSVAKPLIRSLAERGATDTTAMLMEIALRDEDDSKRVECLGALRVLGDDRTVGKLVRIVWDAQSDPVRQAAVQTLMAVCQESDDRRSCVEEITTGLHSAPVPARAGLLKALGPLGGPRALEELRSGLRSDTPEVHDAAVRALAQSPDPAAAPDLLKLARSASSDTHRVLALRGYVRLVGAMETSPEQKTHMFAEAMDVAGRPDEKRMVLGQLGKVPTPRALEIALSALEDEKFREEAAAAIVGIAEEIAGSEPDAAARALERVQEVAGSDAVLRDARKALAELRRYEGYVQTWQVAGPYTASGKGREELFDLPFPPETDPGSVAWRAVRLEGADEVTVDLDRLLGGSECVAYLRAYVRSDRGRTARLELGSDDGVRAWLNGRVVHANNTRRGVQPGEDRVQVELKKGWNELLLKVTQGGGDWAACARIVAPDGAPIEGFAVRAEPPR